MRPEHLKPTRVESGNDLTLAVEIIEPLGADTLVHGRVDGTEGELVVRLSGEPPIEDGKLRLSIAPERICLFDPSSGTRLR